MEENTEQRVDLTLFSEKIQELKDRIASVIGTDGDFGEWTRIDRRCSGSCEDTVGPFDSSSD